MDLIGWSENTKKVKLVKNWKWDSTITENEPYLKLEKKHKDEKKEKSITSRLKKKSKPTEASIYLHYNCVCMCNKTERGYED